MLYGRAFATKNGTLKEKLKLTKLGIFIPNCGDMEI